MSLGILDLVRKTPVLLDGAMGTELMKHGFSQGMCPEAWNLERPKIIRLIHSNYFDAGSDAVLTNSFGGSRIKLASYGWNGRCRELNRAAAELAVSVRPAGGFVGGSIGPTGQFLEPQGTCQADDMTDSFAEQAAGLHEGGVDFFLIETQYDLREALSALDAARSSSDRPVFVTMTFNRTPKGFFTLMGNSLAECADSLTSAGASAVGANCTLDSSDMARLVQEMKSITSLPLIAQANAGQPRMNEDGKVFYSQGIDDYVLHIPEILANGADMIGGCCGTDPDYIRRMKSLLPGRSDRNRS